MGDGDGKPAWQESDSTTFMDWSRYFVPRRATQIRIILDLVPNAGAGDGYVELCCGEGRLSEALLRARPEATLLALDGSAAMRRAAAARLAPFGDRACVTAFDLCGDDWRKLPQVPTDPLAIVSSLAVHHLDDGQKQKLYADMHNALKPGGRLIIADLIEHLSPAAKWVATWTWDESTREAALEHQGPGDPYQQFMATGWNYYADPNPDPIDKPSPLLAQLKWLEQAGFIEVDVHWLLAGHAIFSGRKAT
ncbi:MAG: methyltransferase domain-containing protein [Proteobacteria bacterium]|nr:methyltransferase domain-containing protein [Pseudomonadota bacterium]